MPRSLIAFILAVVLILILTSWPFRGSDEGGTPLWLSTEISSDSLKNEELGPALSMPCVSLFMDSSLYYEGWDTLLQPKFWQQIMQLPPDTVLVNIAKNRRIVDTLINDHPIFFNERLKKAYEDSTKRALGMKRREELFFTHGRSHFYQFAPILPDVDSAIKIFEDQGVDPWYAQAILLIESPGHLQYSVDGAYGAFQLMKGVAREMGLKINDQVDEREDFEKSAIAAAKLIDRVCLPHTRELCRRYRLNYDEGEIWFRLLVMHVYHAGIGNVRRVVRKIRPKEGNRALIEKIWQTKSRRFGNASQNYTQIALAAIMTAHDLMVDKNWACPEDSIKGKEGIYSVPF